jgi:hypothetical protein
VDNEKILKKAITKVWGEDWMKKHGDNFVDRVYHYKNVYYSVIFSHSFAKAIWGEEKIYDGEFFGKAWEYHLQQMVLEENPLKYLEKFL